MRRKISDIIPYILTDAYSEVTSDTTYSVYSCAISGTTDKLKLRNSIEKKK